tara:strand:- start:233 stop:535 length:303 start_codon:yes stop_codon:yes gene_type:complete
MIKLFWILLLINLTARAQMIQDDKLLHMGGSYLISSAVSSVVYNKTKNKKCSFLFGLGASILVGSSKEIYDIKNGDSNWEDMLANTIGATLGIVTIKIAI